MSKLHRTRLLAIDIDGTLLNSSHALPERNLAALRRAHAAGMELALVTGRRHEFALPIARQLGFDLCLISSNGAVTRTLAGELVHRDLLPRATAHALLLHMEDFRRRAVITFDVQGKGSLALERFECLHASVGGWLEKNRDCIVLTEPIEAALVSDPVQAMYCGGMAEMSAAEARLQAWPRRHEITVLKTHYPLRDLALLDVLNCECSKGHALARWAAARGIAAAETAAIGDNFNDVEMLNFAGRAYIVENACAELKQNGWLRARSNDDCGVAEVIEELLG